MTPMHRLVLLFSLAALNICAQAQNYPVKPLRMIVPLAPGGAVDTVARTLAQGLSEGLHQTVVVDNRGGGATNIGTEQVARAAPDGYTLLLTNSASDTNVSLYPNLPFDFRRDIAAVSLIATTPLMLVVHPSVPAHSMRELIALAKARPGQLTHGSAGISSPAHIAGEMLNTMAGIKITHVPYKGGGPAIADLLGGQITMSFSGPLNAMQFVRAGRLRALGMTGSTRFASAPEVPTIAEAALPGYELVGFFALFVTAGTPPDIIARLNAETVRVLNQPDYRRRIGDSGAEIVAGTPAELDAFVRREIDKYARLVRSANIRPE